MGIADPAPGAPGAAGVVLPGGALLAMLFVASCVYFDMEVIRR